VDGVGTAGCNKLTYTQMERSQITSFCEREFYYFEKNSARDDEAGENPFSKLDDDICEASQTWMYSVNN